MVLIPSMWRETHRSWSKTAGVPISIRSFHAEGDLSFSMASCPYRYFNPLLPCGRRRRRSAPCRWPACISIHSFHAEGDYSTLLMHHHRLQFQSTPSMRKETRSPDVYMLQGINFNPLLPCGRRPGNHLYVHTVGDFNPLPPYGRRQSKAPTSIQPLKFQSTPSIRKETMVLGPDKKWHIFQSTPSIRKETVLPLGI